MIKKNKKNRENERNEPDIIDSEMLWFLMHRLRRSAARVRGLKFHHKGLVSYVKIRKVFRVTCHLYSRL